MSRPTELQLRHPDNITSAIYYPSQTYQGNKYEYAQANDLSTINSINLLQSHGLKQRMRASASSGERQMKALTTATMHHQSPQSRNHVTKPFITKEQRFFHAKMKEKSNNIFVGPHRYEPAKPEKCSPCLVKIQKPKVAPDHPHMCLTMYGGHSVIYSPAFETKQQRVKLMNLCQEEGFIPKAPQVPNITHIMPKSCSHSNLPMKMRRLSSAHKLQGSSTTAITNAFTASNQKLQTSEVSKSQQQHTFQDRVRQSELNPSVKNLLINEPSTEDLATQSQVQTTDPLQRDSSTGFQFGKQKNRPQTAQLNSSSQKIRSQMMQSSDFYIRNPSAKEIQGPNQPKYVGTNEQITSSGGSNFNFTTSAGGTVPQANMVSQNYLNGADNGRVQKSLPTYKVGYNSASVKKKVQTDQESYTKSLFMLHAYGQYDNYVKAQRKHAHKNGFRTPSALKGAQLEMEPSFGPLNTPGQLSSQFTGSASVQNQLKQLKKQRRQRAKQDMKAQQHIEASCPSSEHQQNNILTYNSTIQKTNVTYDSRITPEPINIQANQMRNSNIKRNDNERQSNEDQKVQGTGQYSSDMQIRNQNTMQEFTQTNNPNELSLKDDTPGFSKSGTRIVRPASSSSNLQNSKQTASAMGAISNICSAEDEQTKNTEVAGELSKKIHKESDYDVQPVSIEGCTSNDGQRNTTNVSNQIEIMTQQRQTTLTPPINTKVNFRITEEQQQKRSSAVGDNTLENVDHRIESTEIVIDQ